MFKNHLHNIMTMICLFLSSAVSAQDTSNFVILPTSEIQLNTSNFSQAGQNTDWTEAVRAYTDTSDRAVAVWCNDISSSDPALAVSTKSMIDLGLAACPAADNGNTMTISVPKDRIPESYGDMSGLEGENLFIFLRTPNTETHEELSGIGQALLRGPYEAEAGDIFTAVGDGTKETFFPNFCQMCGCCTEGIE